MSVTAAKGFSAAGVAAGLKSSGAPDVDARLSEVAVMSRKTSSSAPWES